jgi:two-component system response regulator YesN
MTEIVKLRRVLIVDDEMLVRVGLKTSINWEENGYQIVGDARNGKEALEMFAAFSPQIVISDISMPQMDGLAFIEKLHELSKNVITIILTHYENFDYAKKAIDLDVSDYLLKSDLTEENLLKTLNSAVAKHEKLFEAIDLDAKKENNNKKNEIVLCEDIKENIISLFQNKELKKEEIDSLNTTFAGTYFCFAGCTIIDFIQDKNSDELQENNSIEMIQNLISEILSDNPSFKCIFYYKSTFIIIFNFMDDSEEKRMSFYHLLNIVRKNIKQFFNFYMTIGISGIHRDISSFELVYRECKSAIENCFYNNLYMSFFNKELELKAKSINSEDFSEKAESIMVIFRKYLKDKNSVEFLDILKKFGSEIKLTGNVKLGRFVVSSLLSELKKFGILQKETKYLSYNDFYHFDLLYEYVGNCLSQSNFGSKTIENNNHSYAIKQCIDYIDTHYTENMALTDLADHIEMSRSYLSFLFKKETGYSFSRYLMKKRVDISKTLLTASQEKIYIIAEKVGFDNPYYFSKVFKEQTGFTCKEYREKQLINKSLKRGEN